MQRFRSVSRTSLVGLTVLLCTLPGSEAAGQSGKDVLVRKIDRLAEDVEEKFAALRANQPNLRNQPVAVIDFVYGRSNQIGDGGREVARMLYERLMKGGTVSVLFQKDLEKVLADSNHSLNDLYDPSVLKHVADLPEQLVMGHIYNYGGGNLKIVAHFTDKGRGSDDPLFCADVEVLVDKIDGTSLRNDYDSAGAEQTAGAATKAIQQTDQQTGTQGGLAVTVKYNRQHVLAGEESQLYLQISVGNAPHCPPLRFTEADERRQVAEQQADHLLGLANELKQMQDIPVDLQHRIMHYGMCECPLDCKCQGGQGHGCNCGMENCVKLDHHNFMDLCPEMNLCALIDTSGSMDETLPGCGMNKLEHAKTALQHLAEHLKPGDTISLVSFADDAVVVLNPTDVSESQRGITSAIDSLSAGGDTNLYAGLEKAVELVRHNRKTLNRIILVTDGLPTTGQTDPQQIVALAQRSFSGGSEGRNTALSLSVFAVGHNEVADKLLLDLTAPDIGNTGNLHYVNRWQMIGHTVFQDIMQVLLGRRVKMQVELASGATAAEVGFYLRRISATELLGELKNVDLYAPKVASLAIRMPPTKPGPVPLGTVTVTYYDRANRLQTVEVPLSVESTLSPPETKQGRDLSVEMTHQMHLARKTIMAALLRGVSKDELTALLEERARLMKMLGQQRP